MIFMSLWQVEWILDLGYEILDSRCWILDLGYWILDIGYLYLGYEILENEKRF